jgi:hypothetical protein
VACHNCQEAVGLPASLEPTEPEGSRAEDRRPVSHNPWVAVDASTIPAKRARELRDAWEGFVDGRPLDDEDPGTPQIRHPIADSWLRSRDAGVDPSGRQPAPSLVELDGARGLWQDPPSPSPARSSRSAWRSRPSRPTT